MSWGIGRIDGTARGESGGKGLGNDRMVKERKGSDYGKRGRQWEGLGEDREEDRDGWKARIEGEGGSEWGARMVGRRGALGSSCRGEWCYLTTIILSWRLFHSRTQTPSFVLSSFRPRLPFSSS